MSAEGVVYLTGLTARPVRKWLSFLEALGQCFKVVDFGSESGA